MNSEQDLSELKNLFSAVVETSCDDKLNDVKCSPVFEVEVVAVCEGDKRVKFSSAQSHFDQLECHFYGYTAGDSVNSE